jgi:hydrogenase-4 membrane subunit HyfE
VDVEARMGSEMALRSLWFGPVVAAIVLLIGGPPAALAAIIGAAVVAFSFLFTGKAMSWAARRSPTALGTAALAGFLIRLVLLTAFVWASIRFLELDRIGLFVGLGVTYIGLLVMQARKETVR